MSTLQNELKFLIEHEPRDTPYSDTKLGSLICSNITVKHVRQLRRQLGIPQAAIRKSQYECDLSTSTSSEENPLSPTLLNIRRTIIAEQDIAYEASLAADKAAKKAIEDAAKEKKAKEEKATKLKIFRASPAGLEWVRQQRLLRFGGVLEK